MGWSLTGAVLPSVNTADRSPSLATVAASATCLFWSTVTHGMLVQLSDGTLSVNLSLSWFLAIGAVGAQLLLTSVYTRAVWKWEAKARRDRAVSAASAVLPAAVATRRPARPAPYAERRSIQLASVVPFQSAAASSRDEPLEAALAASAADEQARRRTLEDEEFAAILAVRQMSNNN